MPLIRFAYRWTWRTIWPNLRWGWWCLECGMHNLAVWLPIIWHDDWIDSEYLLKIMEFKLRRSSDGFLRRGIHVGCQREARQMLVAAALCRRIQEDDYPLPDATYFQGNKAWMRARQRDLDHLAIILRRHLLYWWT